MKIIEYNKEPEVEKEEITEIHWIEDFELIVEESQSGEWTAYNKGLTFKNAFEKSSGSSIDEALINLCNQISGRKCEYYDSHAGQFRFLDYPFVKHTKLLGR